MPRTKKTQQVSATTPSEKELSPQDVWSVLEFANELYRNVYTPMLTNQRMQDVTLNPLKATSDGIEKALLDPKNNARALVGYSEFMELSSMIYKRVLHYFSGLLEFNWTYVCTNATDEDYDKDSYKRDLKRVEEFFDKFNPKAEFRTVTKQLFRQEAFYGVFRDDGNYRYIIQELPESHSLITGRWEMGLLFDFDMQFFIHAGVDINMYPPIFKKFFNKAFGNKNPTEYNPAASLNSRTGSWTYYVQTSPKDNFWCFKLMPEQASIIPFLSPYLKDVVLQDLVRNLQKDANIAEASKIVAGQVAFLKDTKTSVRDALSLSPETLAKFLQLMKNSLPDAIKFLGAPLEDIQGIEFKGNPTLYDEYLKSTASASGINSRLIYSYDRQNTLETRLSMDVDINILRPLMIQFENFMEFFVNQRTKKFKFKFQMEGFNTSLDREERINNVFKYADSGIILEQKFATALGYNVFDFRRQLAEGRANGFVEKLTPILKANQMSSKDSEKPNDKGSGGRPEKNEKDLTESGSETRNAGSNDAKS